MNRLMMLLCAGVLLLGAGLVRADEESEPPAGAPGCESCGGDCGVPCPCEANGKHDHDGHFLKWLTYHAPTTPCGVCSHCNCGVCTPPLYQYFLGECEKRWPRLEAPVGCAAPAPKCACGK